MNDPRPARLPVLTGDGPDHVWVDAAALTELRGCVWRAMGGHVLHVPDGDDFDGCVTLAERLSGRAGARTRDPAGRDYRRVWLEGGVPAAGAGARKDGS